MEKVIELVSAGKEILPIKQGKCEPIDLLNRQEIVDRIIKILEVISYKKRSTTFALNGAWGSGKTFVLNMLMRQLLDYQDGEKFFVFHYNCWQYDYYEEPLVAIVAAMLDSLDIENHLFSADLRDKAKAGMKLAKPILEKIAKDFVKNKIGMDLTDLVSLTTDGKEALEQQKEGRAKERSFDEYYSFKKAIRVAQEELRSLCENRTIVVVVDELDRCLPNYVIKVMERLHHLFEQLKNSAVILAVDKTQLDNTILQIFGGNTDTTNYLRKFIDFELQLEVGHVKREGLEAKYEEYFALFSDSGETWNFPCKEFISSLFVDIPIRTQERILARIRTVHEILFPGVKKDESFMCCELLWLVLTEVYGFANKIPFYYKDTIDENGIQGFKLQLSTKNRFTEFFEKYWSSRYIFVNSQYSTQGIIHILEGAGDMQKLLIYYLSRLYRQYEVDVNTFYLNLDDDPFFNIKYRTNLRELVQTLDFLRIIK